MTQLGLGGRGASVVALVQALAEATREGRADWTATSRSDKYLFSDASGSVTIAANRLGGHELELLDPDGQVLETFSSSPVESLTGTFGLSMALRELYDTVVTRGQRTDRVIGDMLARLRFGQHPA